MLGSRCLCTLMMPRKHAHHILLVLVAVGVHQGHQISLTTNPMVRGTAIPAAPPWRTPLWLRTVNSFPAANDSIPLLNRHGCTR